MIHATTLSTLNHRRKTRRAGRLAAALFLGLLAPAVHAQSLLYIGAEPVADPTGIAISASGQSAYVLRAVADAVAVYSRNSATGTLTSSGEISSATPNVVGLRKPWKLALSPDQTRLYVACRGSLDTDANNVPYPDALVVLERDVSTGALSFREAHQNGVSGVAGIGEPSSLAVSADGAHVYVAGMADDALALFARNAAGGLSFVESYKHGSAGIAALNQPLSLLISADDKHVYAGSEKTASVATFARDATTGKLAWLGAILNTSMPNHGLARPMALVGSTDGRFVYVASQIDNAITVFARDAATGALSVSAIAPAARDGVDGIENLGNVTAIALSADESKLFAVSPTAGALTVFRRDPAGGGLTQTDSFVDGGFGGEGLGGALALAASRDGRFVHVAATDDIVSAFGATTTDLQLRLDSPSGARPVNKPLPLTLTVDNVAPEGIASATTLFGVIPPALNVTSVQPSAGSCTWQPPRLVCTFPTLSAGGGVTVNVEAFPTQAQSGALEFAVSSEQHDVAVDDNHTSLPVMIIDTNSQPVAADDDVVTAIDQSVVIDVLANDTDADPNDVLAIQSHAAASARGGAVAKNVDGTLTYTPPAGFTGDDQFAYIVEDIQGASASAVVRIFVNAPPVAHDDEIIVEAGATVTILVIANDTDPNYSGVLAPDVLTVVEVSESAQFARIAIVSDASGAPIAVSYTAPATFSASDTFTYTIADRHGARSTARVTVRAANSLSAQGGGSQVGSSGKKRRGGGGTGGFVVVVLALIAFARSRRYLH